MENPPFEDVFPIQDGDFPLLCLFTGGVSGLWSNDSEHLTKAQGPRPRPLFFHGFPLENEKLGFC